MRGCFIGAMLSVSLLIFGCDGHAEGVVGADTGVDFRALLGSDEREYQSGEFSLLTYNVAGLPDLLSSSNPARNTSQISPLLNGYDLVLVQEDFWYHDELSAQAEHAYGSSPQKPKPSLFAMGDGLNRFSAFALGPLERQSWQECHGSLLAANDCLTKKGFSITEVVLAPGVFLDVYNLHMDAGQGEGDIEARAAQATQLAGFIAERSKNRAVIVAGDTNIHEHIDRDRETLVWFENQIQIQNACDVLSCPEDGIDRVLFRGTSQLELRPIHWSQPSEFVDEQGEDLSDHKPVLVQFEWTQAR